MSRAAESLVVRALLGLGIKRIYASAVKAMSQRTSVLMRSKHERALPVSPTVGTKQRQLANDNLHAGQIVLTYETCQTRCAWTSRIRILSAQWSMRRACRFAWIIETLFLDSFVKFVVGSESDEFLVVSRGQWSFASLSCAAPLRSTRKFRLNRKVPSLFIFSLCSSNAEVAST